MGIRILLVEDEDAIGDFVVRGLREEGFTVEWAATGTDGRHRLNTGVWDVVLLDWWLPRKGVRIALTISVVTAGFLALNALYVLLMEQSPVEYLPRIPYLDMLGGWWLALLFGSLAFNSFQALQMELRRAPWEHDADYWRR